MRDRFWFIALCGVVNGAIVALLKCEGARLFVLDPGSSGGHCPRQKVLTRSLADDEYLGGEHDKIYMAVGIGLAVPQSAPSAVYFCLR